jgi:DNA mismatch repair ATPase MutS
MTALTWWAATGDAGPFVIVVVIQIVFSTPLRKGVDSALHAAEGPARDLDILAHVLHEIETQNLTAPRLRALQDSLRTEGLAASGAIRRLHRLVEWHDWQHNPFFALIGASVLWGTQIAFAIEHWRRRHGSHVAIWLRAVAEFEALGSLAAYHYERPADPFPEVTDDGPGVYDGAGLGHPLIPEARMVRNDVRLDARGTRLLVISGSNMSGKSTLLRTVGINAVLAFAGGPVRAHSLRLSPLSMGATLRIQDSLQEGRSRFYAEITRVREIADRAAGPRPLLFLLDELFHGTNSHDRLVGAAGVLRSLLDRGAIGLITTHDLALTAVAAGGSRDVPPLPGAGNVHFEDHFEGDEIHFDYRMKPGPVTRSNAIALMRAVGLDVDQSVRHE